MTAPSEPATAGDAVRGAPGSPLENLRASLKEETSGSPIVLETPRRPGWNVRYRCDVELPVLAQWRKKAADKSMPEGVDELKLCLIILADQCDAILQGDVEVEEDGEVVTFRTQSLQDLLGAIRAADLVRRWYGSDGHAVSAAQEVMNASGYGEDLVREDPTQTSSRT